MAIKGQQAFKNAFTQALIVSLTPVLPLPNITFKAHYNGVFSVNYQPRPHLVTLIHSLRYWSHKNKHSQIHKYSVTVTAGAKDVAISYGSFTLS